MLSYVKPGLALLDIVKLFKALLSYFKTCLALLIHVSIANLFQALLRYPKPSRAWLNSAKPC